MDQELKLLNIIAGNEKINQRAIAKEVGVSLGTINFMLRQMEAKEYLTITRAANNSARYILTEEGRAHRSTILFEYIVECSEMVTKARNNLRALLGGYVLQGVTNFYLSEKEDEFHRIITLILMEIARKHEISFASAVPEELPANSIILGWHNANPYKQHNKYVHVVNRI